MLEVLKIALGEYATHALIGPGNNPAVLKYFQEIGQKWVTDDETAWCAAFVNWCLLKAGKVGTNSLSAKSFLNYGTATKNPNIGDIVVLWRISKESPYGHVGFFIKETAALIYILGGNQSDEVNIRAFDKAQLLSYRQIPQKK
jgi:uncharacterized protein (TIGR02594 family)